MSDDDKATAPQVLDFDADKTASWGAEDVELLHPFRLAGVVYDKVSFRTPSGRDVARHIEGRAGLRAFIESLAELDAKVFDVMHGSDYARLVARAGEYLAGVR